MLGCFGTFVPFRSLNAVKIETKQNIDLCFIGSSTDKTVRAQTVPLDCFSESDACSTLLKSWVKATCTTVFLFITSFGQYSGPEYMTCFNVLKVELFSILAQTSGASSVVSSVTDCQLESGVDCRQALLTPALFYNEAMLLQHMQSGPIGHQAHRFRLSLLCMSTTLLL